MNRLVVSNATNVVLLALLLLAAAAVTTTTTTAVVVAFVVRPTNGPVSFRTSRSVRGATFLSMTSQASDDEGSESSENDDAPVAQKQKQEGTFYDDEVRTHVRKRQKRTGISRSAASYPNTYSSCNLPRLSHFLACQPYCLRTTHCCCCCCFLPKIIGRTRHAERRYFGFDAPAADARGFVRTR